MEGVATSLSDTVPEGVAQRDAEKHLGPGSDRGLAWEDGFSPTSH